MRTSLPFLLGPLVLLGACAASPERSLPVLVRLSVPELDYTAELSDRGLPDPGELDFEHDPDAGDERVGIACAVLSVDARTALEVMGTSGLRAFSTRADEALALVRACREREPSSLVSAPRLILNDGQPGFVTVANRTTYVAGFRLLQRGSVVLADPVVESLSHGLLLEARASGGEGAGERAGAAAVEARAGSGRVTLDVGLRLAGLRLPIPGHEVSLNGGLGRITLQEPVVSRQRLQTEVELSADECLVLIAEDFERSDRMLVLLLTARRLTLDEARLIESSERGARLEELFKLPG